MRTAWNVPHTPEQLWPALCNSPVELTPRCPVFYLGTPRPTECRLPEGAGEVGAARQCVVCRNWQRMSLAQPVTRS